MYLHGVETRFIEYQEMDTNVSANRGSRKAIEQVILC